MFSRAREDEHDRGAGEEGAVTEGADAAPAAWTPSKVLRLQRSAGNAAVARVLQRTPTGSAPPLAPTQQPEPAAGDAESEEERPADGERGAPEAQEGEEPQPEERDEEQGDEREGAEPARGDGAEASLGEAAAIEADDAGADAAGEGEAVARANEPLPEEPGQADAPADRAASVAGAPEEELLGVEAAAEPDEGATDAGEEPADATPAERTLARKPRRGSSAGASPRRLARARRGARADRPLLQRGFLGDLWNKAKSVFKQGKEWIEDHVVEPIKDLAESARDSITGVGSQVEQVWASGQSGATALIGSAKEALGGARNEQQALFATAGQEASRYRSERPPVANARPLPMDPVAREEVAETHTSVSDKLLNGAAEYGRVQGEIWEGALMGDFNKNPTGWNTVGQIAMGFVPYAGQAADIRDTIAAIQRLRESGWRDGWGNLLLVLIAWIPGVGDAIKAGAKVFKKSIAKSLKGLRTKCAKAWRGVARLIPGLTKGAQEWATRVRRGARNLRTRMVNRVRSLANSARARATGVFNGVRKFLNDMRGWVSSMWNAAKGAASSAVSRVPGILGKLADKASSAVTSIVDTAKRWITGAVDLVRKAKERGQNIAKRLRERIANLKQSARKFRDWVVGAAKEKGRALWEAAKAEAREKIDAAKAKAKSVRDKTVAAIRTAANKGFGALKKLGPKLLRPFARRIPGPVKRALKERWKRLQDELAEQEPTPGGGGTTDTGPATGMTDTAPGTPTGTVWDSVKATDGNWPGTLLPRSFEIDVDGARFWVHPNATEHMAEYLTREATTHSMPVATQQELGNLQAVLGEAQKRGITMGELVTIGEWEVVIQPPREAALLPVVTHFSKVRS